MDASQWIEIFRKEGLLNGDSFRQDITIYFTFSAQYSIGNGGPVPLCVEGDALVRRDGGKLEVFALDKLLSVISS